MGGALGALTGTEPDCSALMRVMEVLQGKERRWNVAMVMKVQGSLTMLY